MDCGRTPFSATPMTFGPPRFGQRRRNYSDPELDTILGRVRATTGHSRRTCHPHPGIKSFPIRTFPRGRPWHIP
jgi:hypothetical protein